MPLVFVHGVNNRMSPAYRKEVAARDALFQAHLLDPLAARDARWSGLTIVNPYWGQHGATFRWAGATVPEVRVLEHLGAEDALAGTGGPTPVADERLASVVDALAAAGGPAGPLEPLGGAENGALKRAALANPVRFVEAVLGPLLFGEWDLAMDGADDPVAVGRREALLLTAADAAARDGTVRAAIAAAGDDAAVLDVLRDATRARFEAALAAESGAPAPGGRLEGLGIADDFAALASRAGELFERAKGAPLRVASLAVLERTREDVSVQVGQFLGDAFEYLVRRGDAGHPGPIVTDVLGAIEGAPRRRPDEPLVVVTHSMGGNIFYDIVTHFAPRLAVDAWVSVGGQVGQLEEMKLFKQSDLSLMAPNKVGGLRPRVGTWLNVFDPADAFSFRAEPVFADARDAVYSTGSNLATSHVNYFKRPSFYRLLLDHLAGVLG